MLTCDNYLVPTSLAEALNVWSCSPKGSLIVSGATDILPAARDGREGDIHVPELVDVTRIEELNGYKIDGKRIRLGANVVGIDASKNNINVAKHHLKKSKLSIKYHNSSPENFKTLKKFDVILNMEIVEHVENIDSFIQQSSRFLKKNGIMFIATLNQTLKSYLFAIVGAEYVLRWLPIGTHEWEKFVKPNNLISICQKNSLKLKKIDGMSFNPLFDQWKITSDKSVNYITEFEKI